MKPRLVLLFLSLLALVSLVAGVMIGPVFVPWREALAGLFGHGAGGEAFQTVIVRQVRLPRVLLGFLVGFSLSLSGTVMQGLFHNPLASPYVLGVASGATAGAAGVIALGFGGPVALPVGAFLGGSVVVALVWRIARTRSGRTSPLGLILAGVALGTLFTALTSFLLFVTAGDRRLSEILFWTMGGLSRASWRYLGAMLPVAAAGAVVLQLVSRELNALALGDEGAFHLGVAPERLRRLLLGVGTLLASTAVACAGTIGFVGLVTPHVMRLLLGPDHRVLVPAAALAGGIFLVWADALARVAMQPAELPLGIVTAFFGVPFFLYLLRTRLPEVPG